MLNFRKQSVLLITVIYLIMLNLGICGEKSKKTRKKAISRENKALLDIFLSLEVGTVKGKDGKIVAVHGLKEREKSEIRRINAKIHL